MPGAVTRNPRPGEHRPGTRSKDLQWLLSPDEADNLLRTSRTAPPAPAAPVSAPPVTTPAEPRVATAAPVPAPVERPAPQVKLAVAAPAPAGLSPRVRVIAALAVILAAVGLGWVTAPLLQSDRGVAPAAVPSPAQAAPAEPAAPPREEIAATVPIAPPVRQDAAPDRRAAMPPVRAPATPPAPVPAAPAVGSVRGVARDAATGAPLASVRIAVAGTLLSALTDAAGVFVITDVPPGSVSLAASAADRPAASRDVVVQAGGVVQAEFSLEPAPQPAAPAAPAAPVPVAPLEADDELAAGGWVMSDLASAAGTLGIPLAVIPGLYVESVSVPESGGRPRVRVAQLTASGQRIVLTETRAGAPVPGTSRVTALRIIPASQTYPLTTGTASFGNLLVTAKAAMPGDSLRALLATLVVAESRP